MNNNAPQNNAFTNVDVRYSQIGGLLDSLSTSSAGKKGKELATALVTEFNKTLKEKNKQSGKTLYETATNDLIRMKTEFEAFAKLQDKTLSGEAKKTYSSFYKNITDDIEKMNTLQKGISDELEKAVPNTKVLVELRKQELETYNDINVLINTQALTQQLITGQVEEQNQLQQITNNLSKEELNSILAKVKATGELNNQVKQGINDVRANTGMVIKDSKEVLEGLDKTNEKASGVFNTLNSGVTKLSNLLGTVQTAVDGIFTLASNDEKIQRYNNQLDRYTSQSISLGASFGTGFSGTDEFENLKDSLIEGINESGFMYNSDQQLELLNSLTDFTFENSSVAKSMASDLAFAKEYMGMSAENLESMYSLQVRLGEDDFVKRGLNAIAALQKENNSLSQQALDQAAKEATDTVGLLKDLGLSSEAANDVYEQLLAASTAMEEASGGSVKASDLLDWFESSLSSFDNLGTMVGSPDAYLNAINNRDIVSALQMLMNGPAATANKNIRTEGLSYNNMALANEGVIPGFDSVSISRMQTYINNGSFQEKLDENLEAIANGTKSLESMKDEVMNAIPDANEKSNELASKLLEEDWVKTATNLATKEYWDDIFTGVGNWFHTITSVLTSIAAVVDIVKGFKGIFNIGKDAADAAGGGSKIGNLFSKGAGAVKSGLVSMSNIGSKTALGKTAAGQALAGTTVGGLITTAGIAGGVVATGKGIWDGVAVGTQGFKDENGNRIEGTGGFGNGAAAAVSNQDANASLGQDSGSGALKGAGVGAMIGTFVGGPLGTAIGGAIGAGVGALAGIWAHNRKEEAREQAKLLKEQQRQTEIAEASKANLEAIKNQRDVVLSNRYDDNRYSYSSAGDDPAPAIPAPVASSNNQYGAGGNYNGVDIDGWVNTSDFGSTEEFRDSSHKGIDFAGKPYGYPVGSAVAGTVTRVVDGYTWRDSDPSRKIYKANYVDVLNDTNGVTYRYYHLSKAAVQKGQQVDAGTVVGYIGNTGHVVPVPSEKSPTAGTHLHFAALQGGQYIDPRPFVTSAIFSPNKGSYDDVTPVLPGDASSSSSSMNVSNASAFSDNSAANNSRVAEVAAINELPYFIQSGAGSDNGEKAITIMDSPTIIKALATINNTLVAMDKRQAEQQKLLDALTTTQIQELGV